MKLDSSLLLGAEIDPRWYNGPFFSLKLLPAKAKGKRFEQIIHAVLENRGHKVSKSTSTEFDRMIDDNRVEIKGSTITKNTNDKFSFLQIRPNQDYQYLMFVSFWFDGTIKVHRIPKSEIDTFIDNKVFKKQHGGNAVESGTYCYNGNLDIFEKYFWFSETITI